MRRTILILTAGALTALICRTITIRTGLFLLGRYWATEIPRTTRRDTTARTRGARRRTERAS